MISKIKQQIESHIRYYGYAYKHNFECEIIQCEFTIFVEGKLNVSFEPIQIGNLIERYEWKEYCISEIVLTIFDKDVNKLVLNNINNIES